MAFQGRIVVKCPADATGQRRYLFKLADSPQELADIHRLLYRTFVLEIPRYDDPGTDYLVDKYHEQNRYFVATTGLSALLRPRAFRMQIFLLQAPSLMLPETNERMDDFMNDGTQFDARSLFRILAVGVALVCVALVLWSIVAERDMYNVAALIFVFLGIPMIRLATTGYFWRKH